MNKRISSLDIFRGFIMVLMALDHTRGFFHMDAFHYLAEDLSKASSAVFLTRWITHFCAPAFALLAGISAFLYGNKVKSTKELSVFSLQEDSFSSYLN